MLSDYRTTLRVTSYDVGPTRELKYSYILRLLQEAAGRQMEEGGLTYERMRAAGCVFLLTNVSVAIAGLPHTGDMVEVWTAFRGTAGALFLRDMRITAADGRELVRLSSYWALTDPNGHRVMRPSAFPFPDAVDLSEHKSPVPPRLNLRGEAAAALRPAGERQVRWSDIDCNGHMNNSVYADLIGDYFPGGEVPLLSEFTISFRHEAVRHDAIAIRSGWAPDGSAVFDGTVGGRCCFEARAVPAGR